jgi:7-cyano-7-deazaguanine reductase
MSVELSLLGQDTQYPDQYCPEILFPIARAANRAALQEVAGIRQGVDWWHVFELSWLDLSGKPCVAIGRLSIPADSVNLIESKSLKLYFNGLNFHRFASEAELIVQVEQDLSNAAQAMVHLQLLSPHALQVDQPVGICLDHLTPIGFANEPEVGLLSFDSDQKYIEDEQVYSDLLRSNCPVTNQPDWGTVFVRYRGKQICHKSLLAYIISFRRHCGFHEQCVERMFADLWCTFQPERLMVYAAYTRRGGLDINPCRISHADWLPNPVRLARQ